MSLRQPVSGFVSSKPIQVSSSQVISGAEPNPSQKGIVAHIRSLLYACDLRYDASDFILRILLYGVGFGIGTGLVFFNESLDFSFSLGFLVTFLFVAITYSLLLVTANKKTTMIEEALPDFLSFMASNIRSGVTYDRALLLSARSEFGPIAREIDYAAKQTLAGKPLSDALMEMTTRVRSEMFAKTIRLIVQGFNSGGNLSELLESTAHDIRRFGAIRKDVSATVLVYQLFMFSAAAIGAPLLYSVTSFLIQVISDTRAKVGTGITAESAQGLPFFGTSNAISPELIVSFSIVAIIITAFFSALAAGVISKGKESQGISYIPALLAIGLFLFFAGRVILNLLLGNLV